MSTDYRWCAYADKAPTSAPTQTYSKDILSPTRAPTSIQSQYSFTFCDPGFHNNRLSSLRLQDVWRRVEFMADTFTGNARITSGGGFSAYWDRPAWQTGVVDTYITNKGLDKNAIPVGFNVGGRGSSIFFCDSVTNR